MPRSHSRQRRSHRPARLRSRSALHLAESLEQRLAFSSLPLIISEVMYYPPGPTAQEAGAGYEEDDFEFVEIQNVGAGPVNLDGVEFARGIEFEFDSLTLAPDEAIVVVKDQAAFRARHGAGPRVAGEFDGSLSNGTDRLTLEDDLNLEIVDFEYEDNWHPTTDGQGYSLVAATSAVGSDWDSAASWRASRAIGGSPGAPDGPVDTTGPSTPVGLSTTEVSSTVVRLAWQPSTDAESDIREYRVYRNGLLVGTSTQTSFTDTTVQPNSDYSYRVSAVNGSGLESPQSTAINVRIAPVGTDPTFADGEVVGTINADNLREASGLVASRRNQDVLWIHRDGSVNVIHAIGSSGQSLGTITLSGVTSGGPTDWEDIAIAPGPTAGANYVYVGDIGDNSASRSSINVYRFLEPTIRADGGNQSQTLSTSAYDRITLRYPSGAFDAEVVLADPLTGDLFVLTKGQASSRVFRAPAASLVRGATVTMELAGQISFAVPSGGDISPDGREILLRNENMARLYVRQPGQSVMQALLSQPFEAPVIGEPEEPNGEAITFDGAGHGYYTVSEGEDQPLYYFRRTSGPADSASVVGRRVFYNNSRFDDPSLGGSDDAAIATDKQALLPGGSATFANYTNYLRGINGIMIDFDNVPGTLSASDFSFKIGNDNNPAGWQNLTTPPTITVRSGAGQNGSDRVVLVWPDFAMTGTWLQVTVNATANTGLAQPDVFYFGNAIGEAGHSAVSAQVTATDEIFARNNPRGVTNPADVTFPYDYNRDGRVSATDQIIARNNRTTVLTQLKLITVPSGTAVLAAQAMQSGLAAVIGTTPDAESADPALAEQVAPGEATVGQKNSSFAQTGTVDKAGISDGLPARQRAKAVDQALLELLAAR